MRKIFSLLLFLMLSLITIPSFAASTIHIVPGPLDGCRVLTPWGDFVVIQNGSTIWVGTEKEYEHARVKSISENNGYQEVKLEGDSPNTYSFVLRDLLNASVGKIQLHSITTGILFGVGPDKKLHRPAKAANSEYVSVSWVQSERGQTVAQIYDLVEKRTYKAFDHSVDHGVHFSEFMLPRKALSHKAGIVFTMSKQKPGYLPIDSIASAHYNSMAMKNKDLAKSNIEPSDDDIHDLNQLHQLDPTIPLVF